MTNYFIAGLLLSSNPLKLSLLLTPLLPSTEGERGDYVLKVLHFCEHREISYHAEAYVRRSVLFAASCILVALHPSYVASALVEGNAEISKGLDWIRTWAYHIAESDTDRDCYTLAMTCLQLHSEMALQTSRALELAENTANAQGIGLPMDLARGIIKVPHGNVRL